ncbi:MAG: hypothetical protein ABIJ56_21835 [Pseudomonadota bacterium]
MKKISILNTILIILIPLLLLFLSSPRELSSTTVLQMSLSDLVRKSDAVVVGTVVGRRSEVDGGTVVTRNRVEIEKCLFGWEKIGGASIDITTLGGSRGDGTGVYVFGEAKFKTGEKFIAFLHSSKTGWYVTGMAQGKMTVDVDEESGAPTVLPPADVHLVKEANGTLAAGKPLLTVPGPLSTFIESILDELSKSGKKE